MDNQSSSNSSFGYQSSFHYAYAPSSNSPKREVRTGGFSAEKARFQRVEDFNDRIRSNRMGDFQNRRTLSNPPTYQAPSNDETASENDTEVSSPEEKEELYSHTQTHSDLSVTEDEHVPQVKIIRYPSPPPQAFPPPPPAPSSSQPSSSSIATVDSRKVAKEFLSRYQWPSAMQDAFLDRLESIPIRYFLICDTTSLIQEDKKRLVTIDKQKRFVTCSRWTELVESLKFSLLLADATTSLCDFRFISGNIHPMEIGFAKAGDREQLEKIRTLNRLLEAYPTYSNEEIPICGHIHAILQEIEELASDLKAKGNKACITIATDSIATDGDILMTLRPITKLPVCILIRLCTDDGKVLSYWQNVCEIYKTHVEVIDDYNEECVKVHENNPWLTYTQSIHQMREYGVHLKELSLLGNTVLTKESVRRVARMIYGEVIDTFPPPEDDMKSFLSKLKAYHRSKDYTLGKVWNPIISKEAYYFNCSEAYKVYVGGNCSIM